MFLFSSHEGTLGLHDWVLNCSVGHHLVLAESLKPHSSINMFAAVLFVSRFLVGE